MNCVYRTGCQSPEECQKESRCCAPLAVGLVPLASKLVSLPPMDSDEAAPILAAMERAIRDMAPVTPLVGAQFTYEAIRSFMPQQPETGDECPKCNGTGSQDRPYQLGCGHLGPFRDEQGYYEKRRLPETSMDPDRVEIARCRCGGFPRPTLMGRTICSVCGQDIPQPSPPKTGADS